MLLKSRILRCGSIAVTVDEYQLTLGSGWCRATSWIYIGLYRCRRGISVFTVNQRVGSTALGCALSDTLAIKKGLRFARVFSLAPAAVRGLASISPRSQKILFLTVSRTSVQKGLKPAHAKVDGSGYEHYKRYQSTSSQAGVTQAAKREARGCAKAQGADQPTTPQNHQLSSCANDTRFADPDLPGRREYDKRGCSAHQ